MVICSLSRKENYAPGIKNVIYNDGQVVPSHIDKKICTCSSGITGKHGQRKKNLDRC